MFWGCFASFRVGLSVFWQKNRKKITGKSYCKLILPEVYEFTRLNSRDTVLTLQFMHENTPVHTATIVK